MKISQNYYLVVDLEATCNQDNSFPRHEMEIIEIGAVMLNAKSLEIESEFQSFVKPILHPQLTDFCRSLTSITQGDVDAAPLFPQAMQEFQTWFAAFGSYLFCSWGDYDKNQFAQDCKLHQIAYPFWGGHLNLKKAFSVEMDTQKRYGMQEALNKLNIPLAGIHHRGIDDARNITKIVQKIAVADRV